VLDEEILPLGELAREGGIVRRLARIEARVLEHGERAVVELAQPRLDGPHREGRILPLGPAEVRADGDALGPALAEELERRQRSADARVVGDPALLERD